MSPRVIEPLAPDEQAAFDLVERVIRRDLPAMTTHLQLVPSNGAGFQYAQVLFGDPAIRFVAGQTMGEAFEAARAMWRRNR